MSKEQIGHLSQTAYLGMDIREEASVQALIDLEKMAVQQAAEIEQLKTNNGKLSATIELRDNVIKQQDAELERMKEKLKAIAEIPASYCGSGASIARITACDKMRQIAMDDE